MLNCYSRILQTAVEDRTSEIEMKILSRNPKYQELHTKIDNLQNWLEQHLPSEERPMITELDDIYIAKAVIENETMYRQGLADGVRLNRLWRWIGKTNGK